MDRRNEPISRDRNRHYSRMSYNERPPMSDHRHFRPVNDHHHRHHPHPHSFRREGEPMTSAPAHSRRHHYEYTSSSRSYIQGRHDDRRSSFENGRSSRQQHSDKSSSNSSNRESKLKTRSFVESCTSSSGNKNEDNIVVLVASDTKAVVVTTATAAAEKNENATRENATKKSSREETKEEAEKARLLETSPSAYKDEEELTILTNWENDSDDESIVNDCHPATIIEETRVITAVTTASDNIETLTNDSATENDKTHEENSSSTTDSYKHSSDRVVADKSERNTNEKETVDNMHNTSDRIISDNRHITNERAINNSSKPSSGQDNTNRHSANMSGNEDVKYDRNKDTIRYSRSNDISSSRRRSLDIDTRDTYKRQRVSPSRHRPDYRLVAAAPLPPNDPYYIRSRSSREPRDYYRSGSDFEYREPISSSSRYMPLPPPLSPESERYYHHRPRDERELWDDYHRYGPPPLPPMSYSDLLPPHHLPPPVRWATRYDNRRPEPYNIRRSHPRDYR